MKEEVAGQSKNAEIIRESLPVDIIQLTEVQIDYFTELVQIFQQVFHLGNRSVAPDYRLHQMLSDQDFIVLTALKSGKIIGGLTAYVLYSYHTAKPNVYLYDLAVLPHWQRRGVGSRLVSTLIQLCTVKGCREIFVQAEADDTEAISFYRKTSVSGETNAIQFHYTLKKN